LGMALISLRLRPRSDTLSILRAMRCWPQVLFIGT
jgi:hypothetical protein